MMGVTKRCVRSLSITGLVALASAGCLAALPSARMPPEPGQIPEPADRTRGTAAVASVGVGWKKVAGKREPHYLIAADQTECMVSRERWEKAPLGKTQLCNWTRPQS